MKGKVMSKCSVLIERSEFDVFNKIDLVRENNQLVKVPNQLVKVPKQYKDQVTRKIGRDKIKKIAKKLGMSVPVVVSVLAVLAQMGAIVDLGGTDGEIFTVGALGAAGAYGAYRYGKRRGKNSK